MESEEVPSYLANNYDLHLPNPPLISHLITIARDLTTFPIATALQTVRPTPMKVMRASPDRADALSFAAGAKILGVEFPDKYQGQWCIGWVDHKYGAIPAEAIQLDPPRKDDATVSRRPSSSSMKAVARWRFFVKEKENIWGGEWLCFSRGEVITNIGCKYCILSNFPPLSSTACWPRSTAFSQRSVSISDKRRTQGLTKTIGAGGAQTPKANRAYSLDRSSSQARSWKSRQRHTERAAA